ncbi:hypothetical protein Q6331_30490, partial [Klebsiella pneumoniae]
VIPYEHYMAQQSDPDLIPHAVVSRLVDGATPIRAWRDHLNLTQEEVAKRRRDVFFDDSMVTGIAATYR